MPGQYTPSTYRPRVIDAELDELLEGLSAIAIEGPKAVGKTATAIQRAATVHRLDDPAQGTLALADPYRLAQGEPPILIDEWQRVPESWDIVRRAVDEDPSPNRFILTGSATPLSPPTHSGAGRIVRLRLRPLSLAEREIESPSVSLRALLHGRSRRIDGETGVRLADYAEEVVASGFPGIRPLPARSRRAQLEGYVDRIVDRDFVEMDHKVRKPRTLRRWMTAYAAATSTTATIERIRNAAAGREESSPTRVTATNYRETLEKLWLLDPVPAWVPSQNYFSRLTHPDKHHLADPALAAILLGVGSDALLDGSNASVPMPRDGTLFGHLFESLITLSVRAYAQAAEARVSHLRTKGGRREVDLIVERSDHRVIAIEIKLGRDVSDHDVRHLRWLRAELGDDLVDTIAITTGPYAYRRKDGVAVVPAVLLGP